jgi:ABC-type nitrate/sulfonate/bicarbonate transport system permease component
VSSPQFANPPLTLSGPISDSLAGRGTQLKGMCVRGIRAAASGAIAVVVVIGLWFAFLHTFHIDPLVAKSPADVWRYLTTGGPSDEPASQVWHGLGRTLTDSAVGFAAGLIAAATTAVVFVLLKPVEQALMPMAIVLRSVPLVTMTPLLTLIFGRALLATTVITGIVVFFPALVTIGFGLRSTSRQAADLVRAYGGGGLAVTRKVMLPSALPAIFASARVSIPGALVGATLAEYLATGKGLGYLMLIDVQQFDYDQLWSAVVVLTAITVLIYYAVGAIETLVLSRFGPTPGRR